MNNITMIVAADIFYGIGKDKKIPWYIPEDFKHFKRLTEHNICIMGRTTYEEIIAKLPNGLPNRITIVVSGTLCDKQGKNFYAYNPKFDKTPDNNQYFVYSVEQALELARYLTNYQTDKLIFFTGGKHIYEEGIRYCDKIYLTRIYKDYQCDVRLDLAMLANFAFTKIDSSEDSNLDKRYSFIEMTRIKGNLC